MLAGAIARISPSTSSCAAPVPSPGQSRNSATLMRDGASFGRATMAPSYHERPLPNSKRAGIKPGPSPRRAPSGLVGDQRRRAADLVPDLHFVGAGTQPDEADDDAKR